MRGQAVGEYWEAARRIGVLGCNRAARRVMRIAQEAAEANRRAAALHDLWLLGDPRATPLLLRVAADGAASKKERIIAVEALGMIAQRPHVQRALARHLRDPMPMVRYFGVVRDWSGVGLRIGARSRVAGGAAPGDARHDARL